jgi:prepilin-type N-terminal cleavage/methylation domain-containing protein
MANPAEKVSIKTSITGKLNKPDAIKRHNAYRLACPRLSACSAESSGFTLVELLLVIVLMGVIVGLAIPSTRDVLTGDNLKKASRQLIGLEKKLRVEAVRDQMDYILCLDLPNSAYFVVTADMTVEKIDEIKKRPQHLPSGVVILDIVEENNKKQSQNEVKIKFGKKNICAPAVIHLGYEENRMTMVINPFLGVTDVYDKYVDIPVTGYNSR